MRPVVLLNKLDLCEDADIKKMEIENAAPGVEIILISCVTGKGFDILARQIIPGETFALIGPSGTGKSTIINTLLGEELLKTGEIREDDKRGRHTTTSREMVLLPSGALLIDTPGLRELQLWGQESALNESFSDIAELAEGCKFRNCRHTDEPDCAVKRALEENRLDRRRYENYLELRKELQYLKRRNDAQAEREYKEKWKKISQQARRYFNWR